MSKDSMMNNQRLNSQMEVCLPSHKPITETANLANNPDLTKVSNPGSHLSTSADESQQLLKSLTSLDVSSHKRTSSPVKNEKAGAKTATTNFKDPYASFLKEENKSWLGSLVSTVKIKFNGAIEAVKNIPSALTAKASNVFNTIKTKVADLRQITVSLAKRLIPKPIQNAFVAAKESIKAFIKHPFKSIASTISSFVSGAMNLASKALALVGIGKNSSSIESAMAQASARAQAKERAWDNSLSKAGVEIGLREAEKKLAESRASFTFGEEKERSVYDIPKKASINDGLKVLDQKKKERDDYQKTLADARNFNRSGKT